MLEILRICNFRTVVLTEILRVNKDPVAAIIHVWQEARLESFAKCLPTAFTALLPLFLKGEVCGEGKGSRRNSPEEFTMCRE